MFDKLLEKHGGRLNVSASQGDYRRRNDFSERFDGGLCSALTTIWVTKRAQGRDFFKYLESPVATALVKQLQGRDKFMTETSNALFAKDKKELAPFAKTIYFMEDLTESQHQWRCDFVRDETGLTGFIKNHKDVSSAAARTANIEGYTILNIVAKDGKGHAVAAYTSPQGGVRFYDPNFGEAYFEQLEKFEGFLEDLSGLYIEKMGGESKGFETTSIPAPFFPKSPEDAEIRGKGFQSLDLSFRDIVKLSEAQDELL